MFFRSSFSANPPPNPTSPPPKTPSLTAVSRSNTCPSTPSLFNNNFLHSGIFTNTWCAQKHTQTKHLKQSRQTKPTSNSTVHYLENPLTMFLLSLSLVSLSSVKESLSLF
ncbi:hypothetical protein HanRHA438_Chr11g0482971 [Helianthus annuus]|nr:hypothetical protein HanRHA438_Chr11g0482971 [Helianthus annuus]